MDRNGTKLDKKPSSDVVFYRFFHKPLLSADRPTGGRCNWRAQVRSASKSIIWMRARVTFRMYAKVNESLALESSQCDHWKQKALPEQQVKLLLARNGHSIKIKLERADTCPRGTHTTQQSGLVMRPLLFNSLYLSGALSHINQRAHTYAHTQLYVYIYIYPIKSKPHQLDRATHSSRALADSHTSALLRLTCAPNESVTLNCAPMFYNRPSNAARARN